jgi:hypothetical protein
MSALLKLIFGLLVLAAGVYWYMPGNYVAPFLGIASTYRAFLTVFAGSFGLVLILFGLIIAWIEYEDIKWEKNEKNAKGKRK